MPLSSHSPYLSFRSEESAVGLHRIRCKRTADSSTAERCFGMTTMLAEWKISRLGCPSAFRIYFPADAISCTTIFFVSSSIASMGLPVPFDALNPLIPIYTASYEVSPRFSTR